MVLEYDNGELLSILWSPMSHSDNHMNLPPNKLHLESLKEWWERPCSSTTVEIMGSGDTIEKAIGYRDWGNPIWMTLLEDLLDLLIELREK